MVGIEKMIGMHSSTQRISNLDVLRAFAAVAVCLVHFDRKPLYGDSFFSTVSQYGQYGVDIFFVISGFVIPLSLSRGHFSIGKMGIFLRSRFFRLYPAYLAAVILTVGFWYLSFAIPGFRGSILPEITLARVVSNLTLACNFTGEEWYAFVSWTLALEAQFYVLLAFCFPAFVSRSQAFRVGMILLWILLPILFKTGPTVFTWTSLFAVGILGFLLDEKLVSIKSFWMFFAMAFLVQCSVRGIESAVAGALTLMAILFLPQINSRPLIWVGSVSYSLYLLHAPIGGRVMNVLERYPEFPGIRIFAVPLALAAALLGSAIFFQIIEKPSHDFARRLKSRPASKTGRHSTVSGGSA
jgi:peptidoglycan/LPS O-acetylase OafA/YrhL